MMHWLTEAVKQDRVGTVADNCHHSCYGPIFRATEEWKKKKGNAYLFDLFQPDDTGNSSLLGDHEISETDLNVSSASSSVNSSHAPPSNNNVGGFNLRSRDPNKVYINSMHSEDMNLSSSMNSSFEPSM